MSESVKTSKNFFSGFWWDIVRSFQVEILSNKLFISNNGIGKLILPLSGKIPPSISPQKIRLHNIRHQATHARSPSYAKSDEIDQKRISPLPS